jgi:DNA sulfur modification protein DndC
MHQSFYIRAHSLYSIVIQILLPAREQMSDVADLPSKFRAIRRDIRDEYLQPHTLPWIVGFSGGKDSTLLLQLVVETILAIAPDQRTRRVFVLSNDTLVESPVYQSAILKSLARVEEGVTALNLPITVVKTHPEDEWSFWVNLLGRGYPAPNRSFRWCTDRMKIRPTTKFIREQVSAAHEVILLLGVRRAESQSRATRIENYTERSNGRLNPHNDIKGCLIFRPILDLSNDEVWHILLNVRAPWGGDHRELVTLYRNAKGGECPFVLGEDDAPSCGSTSARFGCWTCTVVDKDNSIAGLIDSGFEYLEPLASFRDRLKEVSENPLYRSKTRRNGQPGLGPLTIEARQMLLRELQDVQAETEMMLISPHEVRLIKDWWGRDESTAVVRDMERLVKLSIGGK